MSWVHKLYEYDYKTGAVKAKNRKCPRCDSYMALHSKPRPRWHCGKCSYVEYVTQ